MSPPARSRFLGVAVAVAIYAVAMAYVESAAVVYLRGALGVSTGEVFPLRFSGEHAVLLGWVELGREVATLVMIAAVGWVAGRSPLEWLAWAAVVFGVWDVAYYGWLWVFSGWPGSLATWDLLFLLPLPWAGPVWAPMLVSLALVGFGLAMAGRLRSGLRPRMTPLTAIGLAAGGLIVIASFLGNAGLVLAGGTPLEFAWPMFGAGIAVGTVAGAAILRSARAAGDREALGG